ncbi:flagellar hook-associated protein FlgL [Oceanobacillus polygoni]|uniref:Flagellar hook-associated protein 3 FlgL n=1 Tax=Oceanobacillus polygoni TaxID=1235259 RepID=A0A9X1CCM7_9BACI|nr:flagellar hook-associated protein FlgL [Oceanobacillus polygoni]MBP2078909.1 flagellar hook-associated protein 3 FlgL [Oceanobacillus polygoni]
MRVTQGMISNNMLRNLTNSYGKMDTYLHQLSTGKKINRPSDDPVIAMKGMGYRTELVRVEQYIRNTNEVHNWMDNTDAALDKATSAMQRIRDLAVQASNGTYDKEELKNISEEVKQLKEHMIEIANTNVNDKYIFNGTKTNTAPVNQDGDIDFDGSPVLIEVSSGTTLQANVDGNDVFGGEPSIFDTIDNFINKLEGAGDTDLDNEAIDASIADLDVGINNIVNARAELGARMNRLELVENRLSEQEVIATKTMSQNEDIDYAKAITELITQESLHRAALSAGSRIIQPSLVDFLR